MTKVLGFSEWHYGLEYAYESVLSIAPFVDEYCIAYAGRPGMRYNRYVCPDTEEDLRDKAEQACKEARVKLTWISCHRWPNRYAQRNVMFSQATDADAIILTDADEVWQDGAPEMFIDAVLKGKTRFFRMDFLNFWRSFNWATPHESKYQLPLRGYNLHYEGAKGSPDTYIEGIPPMLHFGWAQHPRYWVYKMPSSGHYFRPAHYEWFKNIWLPWTPEKGPYENLHPYGDDRFGPLKPFDKTTLPASLLAHPYYNKKLIGGHEAPKLPKYEDG